MPPYSSSTSFLAMPMATPSSFESSFLQDSNADLLKTHAYSLDAALESLSKPLTSHRLNVKTHVFKKELQEYVPTQIEDRLRIETIIYVELSVVDQYGSTVNSFDYARMPKRLFYTQPDKLMTNQELASKRVIDIGATLHCPSNDWHEEKEACARCARRMSTKLDQDENRSLTYLALNFSQIIHLLPEIHRTEDGDSLISFRNGVANIQFKINCYCGHKKEKEGFVIRFDPQSDDSIASHVTLPLMFYHQNKNRVASRAAKPLAEEDTQDSSPRNIVKSVTSKTKREPRSKTSGSSPLGHQTLPSPPTSSHSSPLEYSISPQLDDFMDSPDFLFTVPSPPPPDPFISLFPELSSDSSHQPHQPKPAVISHVTPNSGPTRGGTFVTVHGSDFPVGEMMYVCFGEAVVPVIPQRDHMLECYTPASAKTETVSVFAMVNNLVAPESSAATFSYVDDNEKELIKLALQRMMSVSARMDGPLDSVLTRANEFTLWSDLLDGNTNVPSLPTFTNLEQMVLESFRLVDTPSSKNCESLSLKNGTGHTMLHLSVSLQFEELARDLIQRGVGLDLQDKNGLTALDLSERLRHRTMTELLSSLENVKNADGFLADDSVLSKNHASFDGQFDLQVKDGEGARRFQKLQSPEVGRNHYPLGQASRPGDDGLGSLGDDALSFDWEAAHDGKALLDSLGTSSMSSMDFRHDGSDMWESATAHYPVLPNDGLIEEGVLNVPSQPEVDAVPADVVFQRNNDDVGMQITSPVVVFQQNNDDVVVGAFDAPATAGQAVVQSGQNLESEPLFLGGLPVAVSSHRRTSTNNLHSSIPRDDNSNDA
ncbi:SPT3 Dosage dependent suppressor of Ty-induced promoter mutations-like protein [Podila clonocystis]|nr:SPT3 Dosage dependent suppressor of Ty-induced promoter mutations-like protein [Podila clonocystis]